MQQLEASFEAKEIVYVPINKLHGIPVHVKIQNQNLCIESDTFLDDHCDNIVLYIKKVKSVKEAIDIIKELKLDNKNGVFLQDKDIPELSVEEWADMFSDCKHIQLMGDMCCVCHADYINTKTGCGHTICVSCVHQITAIEVDDMPEIPCPMCRQDIKSDWNCPC